MISSSKLGDIETSSGLHKLLISFKRPVRLPLLFSYLVFILSYLEVIFIMFAIALKEFKSQPQYMLLDEIIFYTIAVEVTPDANYTMNREVAVILIAIYQILQIMIISAILFQIFAKKQIPNERLHMVFRTITIINYYVLFFPVQSFLIRNFVKVRDNEMIYSDLNSVAFVGLNVFSMIFTIIFSFMGNFTYSQIQDKDYFAKRNPKICALNYLYKVLTSIFLQLTVREPSSKWILVVCSIVFLLISYYFYHTELVFYQIKIVKLMALIYGNLIVCCAAIFTTAIWDEVESISIPKDIFVIWALLLPFALMRERDQIKKIFLEALRIEPKKISTEEEHFKRILGLKWIFSEGCHDSWKSKKKADNPLQFTVVGLLKRHMAQCKDKKCPCDKVIAQQDEHQLDKELSINKAYLNEVLKNMMEEVLSEGAIFTQGKHNVLLDKARFHLRKEDKFLRAYITFKQLKSKKSKNSNAFSDVSLKLLEQMIEDVVKNKCGVPNTQHEEKLHIKELIRHQELVEDMKVFMSQQTEKQLQLWARFNESVWNAHHLFKLSREIEEIRSQVDSIWSRINSFRHNDLIVYLLFGLYSSVVNNNILKSEKLLKKIDVMSLLSMQSADGIVTNANLYDANNMLITIGMDRERLGKVEGFTRNVLDNFGYTSQELMGSNVAILMPGFLRKRHQKFLTKYLDTQMGTLFNSQRATFGMSKKGYALPMTLYVSVYPTLRNGLSYFSVIRPVKDYKEYILLTNNGYIDACTENICKELGIVPNAKRLHISEIAPEMSKINDIFVSFVTKQIQQIKKVERTSTKNGQNNDRSGIEEEETDQITSNLTQTHTRADAPLLPGRGDDKSFNLMTRGGEDKSFNLMTEMPLDSASPRKTTVFETAMETTFRAVNKETTSFPTPTRKATGIADNEESKMIHERFSTEGDVITFLHSTDKALDFFYTCQISEEIYGESVLRILTLQPAYRKSRFEEMNEEDREANVDAEERSSHWQSSPNDRRKSDPEVDEMKSDVRSPQHGPNDAEEESFIQNDVPDEKYNEIDRSKRSNDPGKSFALPTDAVSATSRFRDQEQFLEKDKLSFIETNQFDKSREQLMHYNTSHSFHHKRKTRNSEFLGIEHLGTNYTHYNSIERRGNVIVSSGEIGSKRGGGSPKDQHYITSGDSKQKSKTPAVMNTDPIKKFFQQHSLHIRKDGDGASSTGTTSSASSTRILRAVEKAFGEWNKVNKYIGWILLVATICAGAFGTLIAYFIAMKLQFDEIKDDSSSLFHVGRRINAFVELNRGVVFLDLYNKGLVTRDRHIAEGTEDYIEEVYSEAKEDLHDMNAENTVLRSYIGDLSMDLKKKLYSDITVINIVNETNSKLSSVSLNTFDAVTKISTYAVEILSVPSTEVFDKDWEISSMLNNSFNDLLINLKKPYDTYSAKIDDDFQNIDTIFYIAMAIVLLGFVLVLLISNSELTVISKDTTKFWEALQRFELRNAEGHKTELKILLNGFRQNHTFDELFSEVNNLKPIDHVSITTKSLTKGNSLKDSGAFTKRHHNWTRAKTYLPTMIPASLAFILFIVTLAASKILVASQKSQRDVFVRELRAMDETYQTQSLATTFIYMYITGNRTGTVMNQPLDVVLESQLATIANIQAFINSFSLEANGDTDPVLNENLCLTIFADHNATACALAGGGANMKGLAGIVSYLSLELQFIKDYFDAHYQEPTSVQNALNLDAFVQIETEFDYLDEAFVAVSTDLDETDQNQQESFSVGFFLVLFLLIAAEFTVWVILIAIAYRKIRSHKENHALVLRNIPIALIWESKLMRSYIFTLFKGSFTSIKAH